jgi:hypothetical protein
VVYTLLVVARGGYVPLSLCHISRVMMESGDHAVWWILSVVGILVTCQKVHLGNVGARSCVCWTSVHNNLRQFSHCCNHPTRIHESNPVTTNGPSTQQFISNLLAIC